jgi:hypothetical protein
MLNGWLADAPVASVTFAVNVDVPVAVGDPETRPA